MAITHVGSTSAVSTASGGGTIIQVNKPAGVQAGDVVIIGAIIAHATDGLATILPPAGFTAVAATQGWHATNGTYRAFYKRLDGSEGSAFIIDWGNVLKTVAVTCVAYRGLPAGVLLDKQSLSTGASTSITAPSLTPANPDEFLVCHFGHALGPTGGGGTIGAASGMTERLDVGSTGNNYNVALSHQDQQLSAATATGTRIASKTNNDAAVGNNWVGASMVWMPSDKFEITIPIAAAADDSWVYREEGVWPPTINGAVDNNGATRIQTSANMFGGPNYNYGLSLLRFDTSVIPDNALITSAEIQLIGAGNFSNTNGRSIRFEYYPWTPPASFSHYSTNPGNNAVAGVPFNQLTPNGLNRFGLSNLGNINKQGFTGFRSSTQNSPAPTGTNAFDAVPRDAGTTNAPVLVVAYEIPSRYANTVLADSPRGYWRMGETAGTSGTDISGNNLTGTYMNTPTLGVAGALIDDSNKAALFARAQTEYMGVAHSSLLDFGDVFTLEAWVKRTSFGTTQNIMGKGAAYAAYFNTANQVALHQVGVGDSAVSNIAITDTNWHHIVITKSGTTNRIYIDGVDRTGTVTNRTFANNTAWLDIGAVSGATTIDGTMDEVAVYATALSAARVLEHYRVGAALNLYDSGAIETAESVEAPTLLVGPQYVASSSAGSGASGASSLAVDKPAGTALDDLLVLAVLASGGAAATITPPSGFALAGTGRTNSTGLALAVYTKRAGSSEPANYTVTLDSARSLVLGLSAYRDVNTQPIDRSASQVNGVSASVVAPSVDLRYSREMLIMIGAIDQDSTFSPPSVHAERLDARGYRPGSSGGAARTLYLADATSPEGFMLFQDGGTPPAANYRSPVTGWVPGVIAAGNYSRMAADVERDDTTFTTTVEPAAGLNLTLKDAFRSPAPYSGSIAAGAWDLSFVVRANSNTTTKAGRARFRLYASKNADGTNAREITSAAQDCSITTVASTTADSISSNTTFNPGAITLDNEYLFIQVAWQITTAATGSGQSRNTDVNFRVGSNSRVVTPAFVPAAGQGLFMSDRGHGIGLTGNQVATASVAGENIGHLLSLIVAGIQVGPIIDPLSLGSAETWGFPTLTTAFSPTSINSAEAFGSPSIGKGITGVGAIASLQAFSTDAIITSDRELIPGTIASAQAFGPVTVEATAVEITGAGAIPSVEDHSVPDVAALVSNVSGITSLEAFGAPRTVLQAAPSSILTQESFGTAFVGRAQLNPDSIPSGEMFGSTAIYAPRLATFVAASSAVVSGTSLVLNRPTGVVAGDLVVAFLFGGGSNSRIVYTPPSGWNRLGAQNGSGSRESAEVFWWIVDGTNPASYTFTWDGVSRPVGGGVQAYRGQHPSIGLDVSAVSLESGSASTITAPSVSLNYPEEMLLAFFAAEVSANTVTMTPPTGMTERFEQVTGTAGGIGHYLLSGADERRIPSGASGTRQATLSAASSNTGRISFTVAVRRNAVLVDAPTEIGSAQAFGFPHIARNIKEVTIPRTDDVPAPRMARPLYVEGIESAEFVPEPDASTRGFAPPSIASLEAIPVPLVKPETAYIEFPSIESTESFGEVFLTVFGGEFGAIPTQEFVSIASVELRLLTPEGQQRILRLESLMLAGERGELHYEPRLYLSNIYGEEIRPLPGVRDASISVSNYRDTTWELSLSADLTDAFDPARDYVLVALDVRSDLTRWYRYPMGLYRFDLPKGDDAPEGSTWNLTGASLEMLVANDMASGGYTVPAGASLFNTIRDILTSHGVPLTRITLPPASEDKIFPNGLYYDPVKDSDASTYLRIINNLLGVSGFGAIQTDRHGQFFIAKTVSLENKSAAVHYGPRDLPADDMVIYAPIPREPSYDRFANEVVVYSTDVNQEPPIRAIARNENPNSPVSVLPPPQGLGYTKTKAMALETITDQEAAESLARAELARSTSYHLSRKITTMIDPRRGADEAYLVDLWNAKGEQIMDGKWLQTNWDLALPTTAPTTMNHTLSRNEPL